MATELSFISARQITNDSGVVQAGAKLYFYREDTTTDLTVWQDDGATSAHAQPVVADSGGFVPLVYVDDTYDYKIVIDDANDVNLQEYNNIPKAVDPTSGSSDFAKLLTAFEVVTNSTDTLTTSDLGNGFLFNTGSNSITVTLPSAISAGNGKGFAVKKVSASNSLTFNTVSSQTIDNLTTLTFTQDNDGGWIISDGANWQFIASMDYHQRLPKNYRSGCVGSHDTDTAHDINFTAGKWRSDDDTYDLILTSEITKQIDAAWAAGDDAGGLDTGTVAADTEYHWYLIGNPTTGATDVVATATYGSPTLPSGYTKKRRIRSDLTDGSSNFIQKLQHDDIFYWLTVPAPTAVASTGTGENTVTIDVPTSIRVMAKINVVGDTAGGLLYIYPTDVSNQSPTSTGSPLASVGDSASSVRESFEVLTDTSGQIHIDSNVDQAIEVSTPAYRDFFID